MNKLFLFIYDYSCDASRSTDDITDMQWSHIAMYKAIGATDKNDAPKSACEHLLQAILLSGVSNSDNNVKKTSFSLELLIQAGRILIQTGRYAEAISYIVPFILSNNTLSANNNEIDYCKSSTLHLIVGISYLRQEQFVEAEKWLNVANILEPKSNEIWAYLSLTCLSVHTSSSTSNSIGNRITQAEKCIEQALRLGLKSSPLIREIANSFMSTDRLLVAEDLLRLSIANSQGLAAVSSSAGGNGQQQDETITDVWKSRKLLATILSTQNRAAEALDEYRAIVENDVVVMTERIKAGEACFAILKSLDRKEEADVVQRIIDSFQNISLNDVPAAAPTDGENNAAGI